MLALVLWIVSACACFIIFLFLSVTLVTLHKEERGWNEDVVILPSTSPLGFAVTKHKEV